MKFYTKAIDVATGKVVEMVLPEAQEAFFELLDQTRNEYLSDMYEDAKGCRYDV